VIAGDEFGSGVGANLTVEVVDVNDNPPVFSQHSYQFEVSEDMNNYVLGGVTSTDVAYNLQNPGRCWAIFYELR